MVEDDFFIRIRRHGLTPLGKTAAPAALVLRPLALEDMDPEKVQPALRVEARFVVAETVFAAERRGAFAAFLAAGLPAAAFRGRLRVLRLAGALCGGAILAEAAA